MYLSVPIFVLEAHSAEYTPTSETRGGARGGLRGLKPRMFSVKPQMFLLPCLVSTITCAIKYLLQPQICSLHI